MKKLLSGIFAIVFVLLASTTVYADVLFEPDNGFYQNNKANCGSISRSFVVNGEKGYVSVKNQPEGVEKTKLDNGDTVWLYYSCLYNGVYWGFTHLGGGGWVEISQLLLLYNFEDFARDHADEFHAYNGGYEKIIEAGRAITWAWPGSGEPGYILSDLNAGNVASSTYYTDDQGRVWGFVTYLYGYRNIWLCLSDPLDGDIPAFNPAPPPIPWEPKFEHVDIGEPVSGTIVLIAVLVSALAIGTGVLIKVFWKGKAA
jgi:hypothetical protein